jgi:putative membrane protein
MNGPTMADALVAALHYVTIGATAMLLAAEMILYRREIGAREARLLGRLDGFYGITAGGILLTGLLRVFAVGKPAAFYLDNPVFYAKVGLFIVVALLSVPPTLHYLRWRPALAEGRAPKIGEQDYRRVRRMLHAQFAVFACIPLVAALMARGFGH